MLGYMYKVPSFSYYSERNCLLYLGLDSVYRLYKYMFTHMHTYIFLNTYGNSTYI